MDVTTDPPAPTPDEPRFYPCKRCGATSGSPCLTHDGRVRLTSHKHRVEQCRANSEGEGQRRARRARAATERGETLLTVERVIADLRRVKALQRLGNDSRRDLDEALESLGRINFRRLQGCA